MFIWLEVHLIFFNLFFIFYWSIVDLQCCFSLRCTAKWFNYTYIHSFSGLFSHISYYRTFSSLLLLFSRSVVSDSLRPHGLQHVGLPCPSLSPRVCSDSCPLSWWCHPTNSSSVYPFSSCPSLSQNQVRVFPRELALHSRWQKY